MFFLHGNFSAGVVRNKTENLKGGAQLKVKACGRGEEEKQIDTPPPFRLKVAQQSTEEYLKRRLTIQHQPVES
jgi:hypothetical protein